MDIYYLWYLPTIRLEGEYKKLCKFYHPDSNKDIDTNEQFQTLTSIYDSIIEHRKSPYEIDLIISLSEIYHGCVKDIVVPDPVNCINKTLPLDIPSGITNNSVLIIHTKEHRKINVKIKEINDTKYIRDGFNLILNLDITLEQALNEETIDVSYFNKTIKIPTKIPHSNYRHIESGLGMPIPQEENKYGDLYVVYNVLFLNY